ncbi:hypothetical protein [Nonomuraea salmonea]|uniref:hypothetical protein n=1 Tax=Nonomuraea salmonea TaxID=46181 RepID=UPI002FE8A957
MRDDLTWAEFEADHGDPKAAVRHARAEYTRNPNLVAADALAWSLFKAGTPPRRPSPTPDTRPEQAGRTLY